MHHSMTYLLSLLDKSPIEAGKSASQALQATAHLAAKAEQLGYHRFWVAEHHNMDNLASSSPEVLIAYILARTSKIRVGSGGVMLQHYSAYKVAETFNLLASLAPGRVDIGVGKAPGGFSPTSSPTSTSTFLARRIPMAPSQRHFPRSRRNASCSGPRSIAPSLRLKRVGNLSLQVI
jgi:luciferase family oxidoreductase group 1